MQLKWGRGNQNHDLNKIDVLCWRNSDINFDSLENLIFSLEKKIDNKLLKRINSELKEVIIATNPSTSGNATALYLEKILKDKNVELSRLAVGLPVGSNLEYIDDKTISSAISGRVKLS